MFGILLTGLAAVVLNIPLGVWREHTKKFSILWFIAVHASVPVIFFLRSWFEVPGFYVPLMITLAVAGQFIGGGLARRKRIVIGTWSDNRADVEKASRLA